MQDNFRQISLKYMVSRPEAWDMVKDAVLKFADDRDVFVSPDDLQIMQETLAGLIDWTPETLVPTLQRYADGEPLVGAFHALLQDDAKKQRIDRLIDKAVGTKLKANRSADLYPLSRASRRASCGITAKKQKSWP